MPVSESWRRLGRDPRRNTRAHPANHLFRGLEPGRRGQLGPMRRNARLRNSQNPETAVIHLNTHHIPPYPMLNPPPVPPPNPRPPFFQLRLTQDSNPNATTVFTQLSGRIFPHVYMDDYRSFRQASVSTWSVAEPFALGTTLVPSGPDHISVDGIMAVCTNRRLHPMEYLNNVNMGPRIPPSGADREGPYVVHSLPFPQEEEFECRRGSHHYPHLQFLACQGGVQGFNEDPDHAVNVMVCEACALHDWRERDIHRYINSRFLALCYPCGLLVTVSPYWQECTCDTDWRPLDPSRRLPGHVHRYLCGECRAIAFARIKNRVINACRALHIRPRDRTISGYDLERYIDDYSIHNRNNCLCGKSYRDIIDSLPVDPVPGIGTDFDRLVRFCLVCQKVVSTNRIREWSSSVRNNQ